MPRPRNGSDRHSAGGREVNIDDPMKDDFWGWLEQLVSVGTVVIDRPKGSLHPSYPELVYPLDYGYLKDTSSGDHEDIDVWRGSSEDRGLSGLIVTLDLEKRDTETKLLVGCTESDTQAILAFHNRGMRAIYLHRPKDDK
jgi:inorganic pyrophosphatase